MRFLFWNVGATKARINCAADDQLLDQIARLAGEESPDVFTLIEFGDPFLRRPASALVVNNFFGQS